MIQKPHRLREAILLALAVAPLSAVGTALAQDQSDTQQSSTTSSTSSSEPSPKELDAVTVTGSRIQNPNMTSSSPITQISAEEFKYSGATKVEDLVNQYPQLDMNFDNFQNNPSTGYASISLRNLGASRTLTLVNGHRLPMGSSETTDISIIPAALVKEVNILTGGASAVYGSDAVAGVVNFALDTEFEGVYANFGYSAYQHDNDNQYVQNLMDESGFSYPTGDSGFDGISRSLDLAVGGKFGDGGHAMAWATYRKNEALLQGQRDYSSCTVNDAGTACGGSSTSDPANFLIYAPGSDEGYFAAPGADGTWSTDNYSVYNYAPINYYQRPDTRYTAGSMVSYEVNDHFKPYLETMFVNRKSSTQIAPSGAFYTDVSVNCSDSYIGSLCSDLGINSTDDFTVYVAKRNVEGGPRISETDNTMYRIVAGAGGQITDYWTYDASFTYGASSYTTRSINDFITSNVQDALTNCPDGSFDGCVFYDVWHDAVTTEAAEALQGTGITNIDTELKVLNAYATGDLGFGLPWANGEHVNLVAGYEWRSETYKRVSDTNTQTGNFTGVGGPYENLAGSYHVGEVFLESAVPLVTDVGALDRLDADLGYRYSDYNTSAGTANTYKIGLGADLFGKIRLRTGWNRAIRAPSIGDLYSASSLGLWGGSDPCSGSSPSYTLEQCENTGVTASQYGNISANPAAQYNSYGGGNPDLSPETASTWTFGVAANPIDNLNLSVDYYAIKIEDAITTLGESQILTTCATTGDPEICGLIHRNSSGSLWIGEDSYIVDTLGNFGTFDYRGLDFSASYNWALGPGRFSTSFVGTYVLKQISEPLPGTKYDCAGLINDTCGPSWDWRHIVNARYTFDRYSVNLRWRYIGELDYTNTDGTKGSDDAFLVANGNKLDAYNYFDLSGTVQIGQYLEWAIGINNIFDKEPPMVGSSLAGNWGNGNSLQGYDQAGRYFFTSLSFRY